MLVKIDPKHVHHFGDTLQLDVQFPEYPDLPTYGLRLPIPVTKQQVKDAIKAKAQKAKAQMDKDTAMRDMLGTDIFEFNIEV